MMDTKTAIKFLPEEDLNLQGLKETLLQSLLEGDEEAFKDCVFALIKIIDNEDLIDDTGLSKKALSDIARSNVNPNLSSICKLMNYLHQLTDSPD